MLEENHVFLIFVQKGSFQLLIVRPSLFHRDIGSLNYHPNPSITYYFTVCACIDLLSVVIEIKYYCY